MGQEYSTNLGLTILPEFDQKQYPGIWADNLYLRNALTAMQGALDEYTGALPVDSQYQPQTPPSQSVRVGQISRVYIPAVVALTYGQLVRISGIGAVLADATVPSKFAQGFVSASAGANPGDTVEITLLGNVNITGLGLGVVYYLSTTPGAVSSVAPSTPGQILQQIGFATSPTSLWFNPVQNYAII